MRDQYIALIAELDKTISMVRSFWIEARDEGEKRKNMLRLDQLLDERFRLMKLRDADAPVADATKKPRKARPVAAPQPPTQ